MTDQAQLTEEQLEERSIAREKELQEARERLKQNADFQLIMENWLVDLFDLTDTVCTRWFIPGVPMEESVYKRSKNEGKIELYNDIFHEFDFDRQTV